MPHSWLMPPGNTASHHPVLPLLQTFDSIKLSATNAVALQDRTDTKYVMHEGTLMRILPSLCEHYRILDIDGVKLNPYMTLYFDTPDMALYRRHHAGGRNCYKVRSRQYRSTSTTFFEIKFKSNTGRTKKIRVGTDTFVTRITPEVSPFLHAHYPDNSDELEPKVANTYSRITLVGIEHPERVTLDVALQCVYGTCSINLHDIVIAEVKQARFNRQSPFIQYMRASHIPPFRLSKYCTSISLLHPVKHNRFKPKLRRIEEVMQGAHHD